MEEQCLRISLERLGIDTERTYKDILADLISKRASVTNADMKRTKCRRCGSHDTVIKHLTRRSADEGEITVLVCKKCNFEE